MKSLRTILIVDDFAADRKLFRRLLAQDTEFEYRFVEADNGTQALELCRDEEFDCVLLDYDLPDLNGAEVLRGIVAERGANPVPIVMLSGSGDLRVAVAALKLGAHDSGQRPPARIGGFGAGGFQRHRKSFACARTSAGGRGAARLRRTAQSGDAGRQHRRV